MNALINKQLVGILILNLTGCTAWTVTRTPLSELTGQQVRVTTMDRQRVTGRVAAVDSLGMAILRRSRDFAVDTASVVFVEKRQISTEKTLTVVGVIGVVYVSLILMCKAFEDSWDSWGGNESWGKRSW